MSKRLEDVESGTPVYVGEQHVGEVRGVYAVGDSKLAEYLNVMWESRQGEVLVPTTEVLEIQDCVVLQGPIESYSQLASFDATANPAITRLH